MSPTSVSAVGGNIQLIRGHTYQFDSSSGYRHQEHSITPPQSLVVEPIRQTCTIPKVHQPQHVGTCLPNVNVLIIKCGWYMFVSININQTKKWSKITITRSTQTRPGQDGHGSTLGRPSIRIALHPHHFRLYRGRHKSDRPPTTETFLPVGEVIKSSPIRSIQLD